MTSSTPTSHAVVPEAKTTPPPYSSPKSDSSPSSPANSLPPKSSSSSPTFPTTNPLPHSPPASGSTSPSSPPRATVRITATHPPAEGEGGQQHHHHHSSSQDRDFRRRSLAMAQMASINTTAANSLRQRNNLNPSSSSSTTLNPGSTSNSATASSSSSSYHHHYRSHSGNTNHLNPTDQLLPLLSPSAQMAQQSPDKPYQPGQEKSLSGIAERAFLLGNALAIGLIAMVWTLAATSSPLWRLPFFLSALSIFHFLEFWTTAKYNTPNACIASFLLASNGKAYILAHASAFVEAGVVGLFFPNRSWAPFHAYISPLVILTGLMLVVAGQAVRSAAMIQCGTNFNHTVQHQRARGHELVTTGIYATFRHPSYFGYFWWALGTQLVLGNVVCFFGFAVVLWRFFSARIRHEEELLVRFFGDEYVMYRRAVGTKIPFI